ncbi:MAG: hydantoinase B/oxoprolinase family protein [Chloroflexi bacterium]|nr:hydantoinase B/oxoprolinase family protein [Chloroflexota bacterium]
MADNQQSAISNRQSPDPFTLEIIACQLRAAASEMFVAVGRASQSPIIYEVLDYACGITDARGQLVAEAEGIPGFIGVLGDAAQAILDKYSDDLRPGDIFITNDPYGGGGSHLSDVALIAPIFFDGELVAFGVNKSHWTEVGGMSAGSWTTDSTEIYQEGLLFPAIRLYHRGEANRALLDLLEVNVRTPAMTLGDLHAGVAALKVTQERVGGLCAKYGVGAVRAAIERLLDQGERAARARLADLPPGAYRASGFLDDDGLTDDPIPIQVAVTITPDEFICEFTGSAPQTRGPINTTWSSLGASCKAVFKAIIDPHLPTNDGVFRPMKIIAPPGCVFNALRPAPVSTYWESGDYATDLIWRALAEVVPDRLSAGHSLSVCGTILTGEDGHRRRWILVEPQAGGWGASEWEDGESGLVVAGDGETYNIPIEVAETRFPIRVERYALNEDGAGAGRRRGGRGLVREYRLLAEAELTASFGRHKFPPWGAAGGRDGSVNAVEVHDGDRLILRAGKVSHHRLKKGDLVRLITGTGGGWGKPE